MILMQTSINTVIGHINQHCFLNFKTPLINYIAPKIKDFTQGNHNAVYMATIDPLLDQRFLELQAVYEHYVQPSGESIFCDDFLSYYNQLLDSYPNLKAALEAEYHTDYPNPPDFHQALNNDNKALFYFFNHILNESSNKTIYKPLIKLFKQQYLLEQIYSQNDERLFEFKFHKNDFNNSYSVILNHPLKDTYFCITHQGKSTWQYQKDYLTLPLLRDVNQTSSFPLTANQIQIAPKELVRNRRELSRADQLEQREAFYLRTNSSTQLILTLEYFTRHVEKLKNKDSQVYFEANLLQPGLLIDILQSADNLQFLTLFDEFIQKALHHFNNADEQLSTESLFIIHLAYQINQYAFNCQPETYTQRLTHYISNLDKQLALNTNSQVSALLHHYRLLSQIQLDQFDSRVIESLFYFKAFQRTDLKLDANIQFNFDLTLHNVKQLILNHSTEFDPSQLTDLLNRLGLKLDLSQFKVEENFPMFKLSSLHSPEEEYIIDLANGLLFKQNMAYTAPPVELKAHPILKTMGLEGLKTWQVSLDRKTYLLEKPPVSLRFVKDVGAKNNQWIIQTQWPNANNELQWYTYHTADIFNFDEVKGLSTSYTLARLHDFPVLSDRDKLLWARDDEFVITNAKEISHRGLKNDDNQWTITEKNNERLCQPTTWAHQLAWKIEDPKFILAYQHPADNLLRLDLVRYGIELKQTTEQETLIFHWAGIDYQLDEPANNTQNFAYLSFNNQQLCILPIQGFLSTNTREQKGPYYKLTQDIFYKITKVELDNIQGMGKKHWYFRNSENAYILKMHQGKPV